MPQYVVTLNDGRKVRVTAASPQDADRAAGEYLRARPAKGGVKRREGVASDVGKSFFGGVREGAAGLADALSSFTPLGAVNRMLTTGSPIPNPLNVVGSMATEYMARGSHKPQTAPGRYARSVGLMTPNALIPGGGGMAQRAAQVVLPGVGAEAGADAAAALGAGPNGQTFGRVAGAVVGGGVAGLRQRPAPPRTVATEVTRRARQDIPAMRQRAEEMRAAGIQPTLTDVVDDGGRGIIRAAASRPPARQMAQDFADARRLDLPDRIGRQARRLMSNDPRTPRDIAANLGATRRANAEANFGAVRGQEVAMSPETIQALRSDYGRRAIVEAASRERDPEVKRQLLRLSNAALDRPSTPITVGMADRISRVLLGQADEASRRGDADLAATLGGLGRAVREPTADAVPGYRNALSEYGRESRLMNAAERGEDFLRRNTDEFAADVVAMSDDERTLALATGRRAVERAAGENVGSAPGVARRLADAPEQQARNRALLGDRAGQFQDAMRLEARAVENASRIAPNTGSSTALNFQNVQRLAEGVGAVANVARGNWIGLAQNWLRTRGMSDAQAERLVQMATDPAALDDALVILEARLGRDAAREFLRALPRGAVLATPAVLATQTPQQ